MGIICLSIGREREEDRQESGTRSSDFDFWDRQEMQKANVDILCKEEWLAVVTPEVNCVVLFIIYLSEPTDFVFVPEYTFVQVNYGGFFVFHNYYIISATAYNYWRAIQNNEAWNHTFKP